MAVVPPVLTVVDAGSEPARQALIRYFEELDRRFPEGFDAEVALLESAERLNPPQGMFLLVTTAGRISGCGALQWLPAASGGGDGAGDRLRVAEIKRMWVDPAERGHGLGRRLLQHLEGLARRGGAQRAVLDTHGELHEAIALYRSAGYGPIERYNDNPYAQRFFAKELPPTDSLQQRRAEQGDWGRIMALNNSEVPHVGPLWPDQAAWFSTNSTITLFETAAPEARTPEASGPESGDHAMSDPAPDLVALVVAMTDGCGYASPNYSWFAGRYRTFGYIDRIVVRADHAGGGLARRLYDEVASWARAAGKPVLCAEVNLDPPNERSLRFHHHYGFVEVGRYADPRNHHTLAMLEYRLA